MIEHATRKLFPYASVARMDSETMRKRHAHENLFRDMKEGKVQIVILSKEFHIIMKSGIT